MNKNIKCVPFPDIENGYVAISGYKEERTGNGVKKCMSFFFDGGDTGAEWEPEYGPIMLYYKCEKNHLNAKPHWFYEYCQDEPLAWSQLAVKREGLPEAFLSGDYEWIFNVLQKWTE